jgi:hypothetical protein
VGWKALCAAVQEYAAENETPQESRQEIGRRLLPAALQLSDQTIDHIIAGENLAYLGPKFALERWSSAFAEDGSVGWADFLAVVRLICTNRSRSARAYDRILSDPARTARLAHRILAGALPHYGTRGLPTCFSLALLGASVAGLQFPAQCQFRLCYRRSIPWQIRCPAHSRHFRYVEQEATQRSSVRSALKISALSPPALGYAHDRGVCARQLSAVLWPSSRAATRQWAAAISALLDLAPLVRRQLPAQFDAQNQRLAMLALRRALDDLEWDPLAWIDKIPAAETWLVAEQRVSPAARRHQREERLRNTVALLAAGKTWAQVSAELGVKPETLRRALQRERAAGSADLQGSLGARDT